MLFYQTANVAEGQTFLGACHHHPAGPQVWVGWAVLDVACGVCRNSRGGGASWGTCSVCNMQ